MVVDLEDTIRKLAPGLIRYCTARTRDRSLAEDIAQESLAALVQRCSTRGEPDSPQAFVFAVARRRATRAVLHRRLWLPLRLLEESRDQALDSEATALGKSECATLARALERLPARDRDDPLEIRHVTVDLSDRTVLSALRAVQLESGIVLVVSIRRAEKKTRLKVSLPK